MAHGDEVIKKRIVEDLTEDMSVDAATIGVSVSNGVVTLTGEVPTLFNKFSAIDDAAAIHGVIEIDDRIGVKHKDAAPMSADAAFENDLLEKIYENTDIAIKDLGISSQDGSVVITGTVDTLWEKIQVENIVARVQGVASIENHLAVVPTEKLSDAIVANNIVAALEAKDNLDAGSINVEVFDGRAALTGKLSNRQQRKEALDAALYTDGVTSIVNQLTIDR